MSRDRNDINDKLNDVGSCTRRQSSYVFFKNNNIYRPRKKKVAVDSCCACVASCRPSSWKIQDRHYYTTVGIIGGKIAFKWFVDVCRQIGRFTQNIFKGNKCNIQELEGYIHRHVKPAFNSSSRFTQVNWIASWSSLSAHLINSKLYDTTICYSKNQLDK